MPGKFATEPGPKAGDDIRLLWRHVVTLQKTVAAHQQLINNLLGKGAGRKQQPHLVYIKCCAEDGDVYAPVMLAGIPVRNKGTGTTASTIEETDPIPDGSIVLE